MNGLPCGIGFPWTSTVPFSPVPACGSRFSIMGDRPCNASGIGAPTEVRRSCDLPAGCTATAPMIPAVSTRAEAAPVTIKRLRTLCSPCGFRYFRVSLCHDAPSCRCRGADHLQSNCALLRRRAFRPFVPHTFFAVFRMGQYVAEHHRQLEPVISAHEAADQCDRQKVTRSATRNADLLTYYRPLRSVPPAPGRRTGPSRGGSRRRRRPIA